jgi:hypothetical protein
LHHYNAHNEHIRFTHSGYIWLQATPLLTVTHCSQLQATTATLKSCSWPNFSVAEVKFTLFNNYIYFFTNYRSNDNIELPPKHYQGITCLTAAAWANCSDTMTAVRCSRHATSKPSTMPHSNRGKLKVKVARPRPFTRILHMSVLTHYTRPRLYVRLHTHLSMQTLPAYIVTCRGNH